MHLAQTWAGSIDLVTVEQFYITEIKLASSIRLKLLAENVTIA